MRSQRRLLGPLGVSVSLLVMAFACGEDKKESCKGAERCACYPNNTCDADLVCLSQLCVSTTPEGGRSGTNGEGGTGASTPGDAGATGEAGAPTGSSGSPGSAGMDAGGSAGADSTSGGTLSNGGTLSRGGTGTSGGASTTTGGMTGEAGEPGMAGAGAGNGGASAGTGGATGVPDGSLISNGDFSLGSADWNLMITAGTAVSSFTNGHVCVQGDLAAAFTLGWPLTTAKSFVIEPGVPYTLTFRAIAGSSLSITAKIGHSVVPYTQVYAALPALTTAWATYSYNVVASSGDSAAGFVFSGTLLSGNSVCFDDVSLVKN